MRPTGWALALSLAAVACGGAPERELTVSAAASLTFAFQELAPLFEAQTGMRPLYNFASSGHLAHQIEAGAPVDVFASADVSYLRELQERGLVDPASAAVFARGRLVLWTRSAGEGAGPAADLAWLAGPAVRRFALANPDHAPYGAAARQALQRLGLWEALQPKAVLGESVGQALQFAERGDVDAALVSLSLATDVGGHWRPVPDSLYAPLDQAAAAVAGSPRLEAARRFVAFLSSPEARQVLARHGLTPAEARP
ncbi:MAG: molybdate ABC transporter substrate-binding protein [Gemmatimonadota bacterium]